ncbi:MAG: DUF4290 domain-containing protein [Bacteroidota bacterium]|nr:DUF4290 domain-containing protein [Bacteroidota bacterium]
MDYNTERKKLVLPEYGRNIQKMVDHIKTIEDRELRIVAAKQVITVMGNKNPHLRDIPDFKHKLWDHIYIMADFDLDIDSPYPIPVRETFQEKPQKLEYPGKKIRFKHYGKTLENMILAAIEFEDGSKKDLLVEVLANHMKKSFLFWNSDSISDENIFNDLKILSKGKLQPKEGLKLLETKDILGPRHKKKKHTKSSRSDSRSRSHSHSHN